MKILIIGPLGAGKSTLAYQLNKRFNLPRLNLDEVSRVKENGVYRTQAQQQKRLEDFINIHSDWVMEGCQKKLYKQLTPDLIVDMRVHRFCAIFRFTIRFLKAKKLIGQTIPSDLPVQAYHYRKVTFKKIQEWDRINRQINAEIKDFVSHSTIPVIPCRGYKDYKKVFQLIK